LFVVGGFGELVDQLSAGQVADPASGFGGCSVPLQTFWQAGCEGMIGV
jgi:hypothetical protein